MSFESLKQLKTLIRADSSSLIGHGHIRRDLVLAGKILDVSFACKRLKGDIVDEIYYQKFIIKTDEIGELIDLINYQKFELLIIDHYGISENDEREIKNKTGVKILSFDDELKEHYCDILLNVNLFAKRDFYVNLVPKWAQIWCGEKFLLVRDEFYFEREKKAEKKYDYFIAFGGTDELNLTQKVAEILLSKNFKIAVATTNANVNLSNLEILAQNDKNFHLFINSNQIAKLMNQSDELIISASSLVNEAIVLGAKFRAVKVAQNQSKIHNWLNENGFLSYEKEQICQNL